MIALGTWPRFLSVLVCLLATAMALNLRSAREAVAPQTNLAHFPHAIDGWNGSDLGLSSDEVATLGPGQFLLRDYDRPNTPTVTLFLAYYPSQQTGDTMHSPKNCLPGSGWEPTNSGVIQLQAAGGKQITANRYIVAQGKDRMVVLYWYQAHGHTEASEYWAKWRLVRDAITMNRTDGALVRVETPIEGAESVADAENRAVGFAQEVSPLLNTYIPR
ncbi:MAG: exosortase C-terminal domain/associated protein EpsI [Candidatus Acidiferrum sp.]